MLLLTTRECEAVPVQRRACALPTAASAEGTPDISLDRSSSGGHTHSGRLLQPASPRTRNNKPKEKLRRGQAAPGQPWMKEYHIYRTDSSWSTQISWGKCFAFGELAQKRGEKQKKKKSKKTKKKTAELLWQPGGLLRESLSFRMDYPSLYMCKSKRGIKREDGAKVGALAPLFSFLTEFR